jgi:crotonobetainyl-CoA:carnitine CoA-transferase CaiB-like acyl-CoA transferase
VQPFSNLKVLDLTHVYTGPFCTYQLGVFGADVIKVESPSEKDCTRDVPGVLQYEDYMSLNYLTQSANKRSITLNLKTEKGRELFRKLVAETDVLVENYRAGALDELGLGYADLAKVNPRLVYCSITGYGHTGPKRGHTAYDGTIQAVSGLMAVTGTKETGPLKAGAPVIDYGTGVFAAFAIASALLMREKTGKGQHIDVSMMDSTMMLMSSNFVEYFNAGVETPLRGNNNTWGSAGYGYYSTADGKIMIGAYTPEQRRRMWEALDRHEQAEQASVTAVADVAAYYAEEQKILQDTLMTRKTSEWLDLFFKFHVPASEQLSLARAATQEQVQHRNLFHKIADPYGTGKDLTVPVSAFMLQDGAGTIRSAPPRYGEHTEAVLRELGLNQLDIQILREEAVV